MIQYQRRAEAFEIFHRLFFAGGSYTFDPRTDRLVQLFPFDFWSETTLVVGGMIVVLAALVWFGASRLARAPATTDLTTTAAGGSLAPTRDSAG